MGPSMLKRLGQVIYWGGCGGALLAFMLGIYMAAHAYPGGFTPWIAVGGAVVSGLIWLLGRATFYVLSGE